MAEPSLLAPARRLQPPQPEVAVIEHHCWPLCRLQPPKPEDRPAAQFKPGTVHLEHRRPLAGAALGQGAGAAPPPPALPLGFPA